MFYMSGSFTNSFSSVCQLSFRGNICHQIEAFSAYYVQVVAITVGRLLLGRQNLKASEPALPKMLNLSSLQDDLVRSSPEPNALTTVYLELINNMNPNHSLQSQGHHLLQKFLTPDEGQKDRMQLPKESGLNGSLELRGPKKSR